MQLEQVKIETSRLTLSGLWNGISKGAPVIALHGWLDNAASFEPLAEYMTLDQPFYAIDLAGHGLSEHRPKASSYHMIENVIDIAALVSALSPNGLPVILLGHSFGGIIAALFAAASPASVERLVMLDSLGPMTDQASAVLPQLRKAVEKASSFKASKLTIYPSLEAAATVRTKGVGKINYSSAMTLVKRGLKAVDGGFTWTSDSRLMAPSFLRLSEAQLQAIFAGIECPVCLVCGDDRYFSDYKPLSKRLSYIPHLEKNIVSGGHHFHMEGDILKTTEIINEFINA